MSEGLKNKLYDYEVAPPEKAWEKIASALDETEMEHRFPSTLYGMEITPPSYTWEKIKADLDPAPLRSVPRISRFFLYAAAAIVIGLIALAGFRIFRNSPSTPSVAKQEKLSPAKNTTDSGNSTFNDSLKVAPLQENDEVVARLDVPSRSQRKLLASNDYSNRSFYSAANLNAITEAGVPDLHEEESMATPIAHLETKSDKTSRYILLMTPDGNIVRMSKKLSDMVCCVSGQEQDEGCKTQLKVWRDKMVNSSVAPSTSNFMDILNLVSTLQGSNN